MLFASSKGISWQQNRCESKFVLSPEFPCGSPHRHPIPILGLARALHPCKGPRKGLASTLARALHPGKGARPLQEPGKSHLHVEISLAATSRFAAQQSASEHMRMGELRSVALCASVVSEIFCAVHCAGKVFKINGNDVRTLQSCLL